jgi:transposase
VLALDDLESDIGQVEESHPITIAETAGALPKRKPLPDHLPREKILLDVPSNACPCCGGTMHRIGENDSEMLDWVPVGFV